MAHIFIDTERCKGCYFCIKFCAKDLITKSDIHNKLGYFPAVFDKDGNGKCTGCITCAVMCPDTAIEVYK